MHAIEVRKRSEYIPLKTKVFFDVILSFPFVPLLLKHLTSILGENRTSKILENFTLKDINYFSDLIV